MKGQVTLEQIHGHVEGIRDSVLKAMAEMYDMDTESGDYVSRELLRTMAMFSCRLKRELGVYLSRDGEVLDIQVGTLGQVDVQAMSLRRNQNRLSRVRFIHTHPGGDGRLSDVDLSALRSLHLDAMTAVGVLEDRPTNVQSAFLWTDGEIRMDPPVAFEHIPDGKWLRQIEESDRAFSGPQTSGQKERAVLMGMESESSLDELGRLAESAGAEVVGSFLQKRDQKNARYLIGSGRVRELALQAQALEADLCIFDEELTGLQVRNLEEELRVRVIDRTTLILDIFALRARSAEGRLQVELAQLEYQSTHLLGQGLVLSRLGGGIGTRGPGETRLEMNRRRIRQRMTEVRRSLQEVESQRSLRRKKREKQDVPAVALVGYTNAGKSTLLNALTDSDVYVRDQLFATLDAVSRRVTDGGRVYLLTDTVGFIRKLPHTLVKAFRSTLEEAVQAQVLVLVHDGHAPEALEQRDTVEQVLESLGAVEQPRIHVLNKTDLGVCVEMPGAIPISAATGEGLEELRKAILDRLDPEERCLVYVPFDRYGLMQKIRSLGCVEDEKYTEDGACVRIRLRPENRERVETQYGLRTGDWKEGQA